MFNQTTIKSFFITIYAILVVACSLFVTLLWNGFDHIEAVEAKLAVQQNSVVIIKDIQLHTVQIQQFLTDVGATHRQAGFQEAESHLQAAEMALEEIGKLRPELLGLCRQLQQQLSLTHANGVSMAWDFIKRGIDAGNLSMERLDSDIAKLNQDLNRLAKQLDAELQRGITANHETIRVNRLILLGAVPIVLLFFGVFIGKIGMLLKREMESLQQRTTQLNTILDTAASAIVTIDKSGAILSFNQAAERIFGYRLSEIIGDNISILMPDSIAALHNEYLLRYLDTQQSNILGKRRELEAKRKNGEIFPILLRVNPMTIDGQIFFSGVIDDISETKTLQTQLVQAQKLEAIGQLASGVAHEINTPIQYIGDNLSALGDNFSDIASFQTKLKALLVNDATIKRQLDELIDQHDLLFILEDSPKAIKQAQEGVERVAEIVKAMKTFSHVESSRIRQCINLHQALNSVLTITRNSYKYVAEIETDFAADVGDIECYASELNQVFLNLIINATHAIEEKQGGKGVIRLVTRKLDNNHIEILIADNGAGIPAEIQEKVFNLFFTTKAVGKGTGQGLSLAHSIIVEKHLGKLFFESTVGVGTTFHIQLPILVDEQV